MTPASDDPLVLTVMLDPASQAHFDRLRERHFPPSINYLRAHVTMFHHLPGKERPAIEAELAAACGGAAASAFEVTGVKFLGRGVAYTLSMPAIAALRDALARGWRDWLTRQDLQPWRPHVTVQNKVASPAARALHAELMASFVPFGGTVIGLCLWEYAGGPWRDPSQFLFAPTILAASR